MSKSQKLAKLGKKSSKNRNLPNFDTKENELDFLTLDAKTVFNYLRLAFTKVPILWYFNPKCHIQIEIDTSSYVISGMLNQLASETRIDGIVTKINLSQ